MAGLEHMDEPSLPLELQTIIIFLSLPQSSSTAYWASRATILSNYSLVCQSWRHLCQAHLFRYPFSSSNVGLGRLANAMAERRDLAVRVEHLRLRLQTVGQAKPAFNMKRLVKHARGLTEVTIMKSGLQQLSLFSGEHLPELRRLHLDDTAFVLSSPFISHSLVFLSLNFVNIHSLLEIQHLLRPHNLPSLRALAFSRAPDQGVLASFAPQLQYLSHQWLSCSHLERTPWHKEVHDIPTLLDVDIWDLFRTHLTTNFNQPMKHLRLIIKDPWTDPFVDRSAPIAVAHVEVLGRELASRKGYLGDIESLFLPAEMERMKTGEHLQKCCTEGSIDIIFEDKDEGTLFSKEFESRFTAIGGSST